MEDFKDVMLSEVPAGGHSRPYGGYQPNNMHSVGTFENYKGILLCDRPSENKILHTGPQPFLPPGAVEDSVLGLQPSSEQYKRHMEARRSAANKKKVNTVQHAHRKALKDLNEKKMQEKLDAVEAAIQADEKKEKFQAKQRELRRQIVDGTFPRSNPAAVMGAIAPGQDPEATFGVLPSARGSDKESPKSSLPPVPPPPVSHVRMQAPADDDTGSNAADMAELSSNKSTGSKRRPTPKASPGAGGKPKKSSKPKWAMTEEEALDAELSETGNLVRFAEELDFEKYLDDYEIREALSIMRERVEELKEEEAKERGETYERRADDDNMSVDSRASAPVRRGERSRYGRPRGDTMDGDEMYQREQDWDNVSSYSTMSDRKKRMISDQAIALAEKILLNSSSLKGVHSKQSLARLLEDITHKNYNQEKAKPKAPMDLGPPIQQPAVASHAATATTEPPRVLTQLKKSTDYVQNLPYLYRCPSI